MKIKVPYFDNVEVDLDDEAGNLGKSEAKNAIQSFLGLSGADRLGDSRHVFAYLNDFRAAVEDEDWWDSAKPYPEVETEIWRHVTPGPIYLDQENWEGNWYVVMEAECDWEIEHGLMMVWRNGNSLCKVGSFDGNLTNAAAYGNRQLENVIYQGIDPKNSTYRLEAT